MLTTLITQTDHWDGPGPWWPVFPLLWFALLVTGAVVFSRLLRRRGDRHGSCSGETRLAERFAAGDIDASEYRDRLAVLREGRAR